ncbi:hypothetical protein X925_05925 [Petrotoga sp. 9T1HF07.CasAA.8.2]|uniref:hypothetical protein n=1 Tax=Petrotoga sp. 9T1HF07.CasAA.8.2 TaxID=1434329 RepID=UPI000CC4E3F2|nr:hypothetical protein [Petrotoga sp. 9T1HF07.CasAA.8.2]PNR88532.1 hypothetical protein X925_05925 [Petrotoga sp. 9T1HF07.CasAA.8.2]
MAELRIVHIEIVSTGKAILSCAYCEGKGGVPSNRRREWQEPCPVCGGSGKVLVEFEEEPFVECSFCEGKGGVPPNRRREWQEPCPVCGGIGAKPIAGKWRIIK